MPEDKNKQMSLEELFKATIYGNSPGMMARISAYKTVQPDLNYETIRFRIYQEILNGEIQNMNDPVKKLNPLQRGRLLTEVQQYSPTKLDSDIEKSSTEKLFKVGYSSDGKFEVDFDKEGVKSVSDYKGLISAYKNKYPDSKLEDNVVETSPKSPSVTSDPFGSLSEILGGKVLAESEREKIINNIDSSEKERFDEFTRDFYLEKLYNKQEEYLNSSWVSKRSADFVKGFLEGVDMTIPYPMPIKDSIYPSEEKIEELKILEGAGVFQKEDSEKIKGIEKQRNTINDDVSRIITQTIGTSTAFILGSATMGSSILEGLGSKVKWIGKLSQKMKDPALTFGKMWSKEITKRAYGSMWLARVQGSGIMGAYNIPGGVERYFTQVAEKDKGFARFLYEGIISPVGENLSEGLLVETKLGSKLIQRAGDYVLGVPVNFLTEEFTNALSDLFTGSKTFLPTAGWTEAQTGALGMSVVFGAGGAMLTSGQYGLNAMDFGKSVDEYLPRFVGSNKYKIAGKVDKFIQDMILPQDIKESIQKANEKSKLFYLESIIGDKDETIVIKRNGKNEEIGYKTLPKELQERIDSEVQVEGEAMGLDEFGKRVLTGRKIVDAILFTDSKVENGQEIRTLNPGKELYNKEIDNLKIKEIADEITKTDENNVLALDEYIRKEAINDKLNLEAKDISDIITDVVLNPSKTIVEDTDLGKLKKKAHEFYTGLKLDKEEVKTLLTKENPSEEEVKKAYDYLAKQKSLFETMNYVTGKFFSEELEKPKSKTTQRISQQEMDEAVAIINEMSGKTKVPSLKNKAKLIEAIADTYDITQPEDSHKNRLAGEAIKLLGKYYSYADTSFEIIKKKEAEYDKYIDSKLRDRYDNSMGDSIYLQDITSITDDLTTDLNLDDSGLVYETAQEYAKTDGKNEVPFIEKILGKGADPGAKDAVSKYFNTFRKLYNFKNKPVSKPSPKIEVKGTITTPEATGTTIDERVRSIFANIDYETLDSLNVRDDATTSFYGDLANKLYNEIGKKDANTKFKILMELPKMNKEFYSRNFGLLTRLEPFYLNIDSELIKEEHWKVMEPYFLQAIKGLRAFAGKGDSGNPSSAELINLEKALAKGSKEFYAQLVKTPRAWGAISPNGDGFITRRFIPQFITEEETEQPKGIVEWVGQDTGKFQRDFSRVVGIVNKLIMNYNGETVTPIYGLLYEHLTNLSGESLTGTINQLYHLVNTSHSSQVKLKTPQKQQLFNFKSAILTTIDMYLQTNPIEGKVVMAYGKPLYFDRDLGNKAIELFTDENNYDLLLEFSKIYNDRDKIKAFTESEEFENRFGKSTKPEIAEILDYVGHRFFTLSTFEIYEYPKFVKLPKKFKDFVSNYFQYTMVETSKRMELMQKLTKDNPELTLKRGANPPMKGFEYEDFSAWSEKLSSLLTSEATDLQEKQTIKDELERLSGITSNQPFGVLLQNLANKSLVKVESKYSEEIKALESLAGEKGFKIIYGKTPNGRMGHYTNGKITIQDGLNEMEQIRTLSHEIGHGVFQLALNNEANQAIKADLDKIGNHIYDILINEDISLLQNALKDGADVEQYRGLKQELIKLVSGRDGKYSIDEFLASATTATALDFNRLVNDLKPIEGITEVEKKNNVFEQILDLLKKLADFILASDESVASQVRNLVNGLELADKFNKKPKKAKTTIEVKPENKVEGKLDDGTAQPFDKADEMDFPEAKAIEALLDYLDNPTKENMKKLNSLTDISDLVEADLEDNEAFDMPDINIESVYEEHTDEEGELIFRVEQFGQIMRTVAEFSGVPLEGKTLYEYFKGFTYEKFEEIFKPRETDTVERSKARKRLNEMLKEKADFKHSYNISAKDVVEAKKKDLYNKLIELTRIQMIRVDKIADKKYQISFRGDEWRNDAGAMVSNIRAVPLIHKYLNPLSELLGLPLEMHQIDQFYSGKDSGYRDSGMKARELAYAFHTKGLIYVNQFADKKTYPIFELKENLTPEQAMDKIYNAVKPLYNKYIELLAEEGYEFYDADNVTPEERAVIVTQTVRTVLEDLKLGSSVQDIMAGNTRLKGRDFVQLMKRWVLASITREITYDMKDIEEFSKQTFNGKPLISSDPSNPIYYKIENGKPRIYVRTVVLRTKGSNNPLLLNQDGIARYDGGSICLYGQLDKIYRHAYGTVNKGIIKNFFYNDGIYLKHAIHQFSAKDRWGDIFKKNNIAFLTNDECEKNQLGGDKYELTSWEDLMEGKANVIDLPLDGFHRVKESASFKEEILGFAQVANACGIIEENPWIDEKIPQVIRDFAKQKADELNSYTTADKARDVYRKVFSTIKNPRTYMENVFRASFTDLLEYQQAYTPESIYQFMLNYRTFSPVKDVLKHIMNEPIKNAVKFQGKGSKVTLTMDTGNMSVTRINSIKEAIKGRYPDESQEFLDAKLNEYIDENGFLKEDYAILDEATAERLGIKAFDRVIIYITPTDSAMGVKAVEIVGIVSNTDAPLSSMTVNSEYIQGVGKDYDIDEFTILTKENFDEIAWAVLTDGLMKINKTYKKETKKIIEKELDREANPFNSKDQLAFMQNFLGINEAVRPQTAKYHILEKEAIDVGDMFYKEIGHIVMLRELHQILVQIGFKTNFNLRGKKYDIDFSDKSRFGKIHYMLLIATNDMVDYPKNNNKDYYNSDPKNMFAKMLFEDLKYYTPQELSKLSGTELWDAESINSFIDITYKSFLNPESIFTKLFSIPRFRNGSGRIDYDRAKAVNVLKKIKAISDVFNSKKQEKLITGKESSAILISFYQNIKYDAKALTRHPIVSLIDNIDVYKLVESLKQFFYHQSRDVERKYNAMIEKDIQIMMLEKYFGIKGSHTYQMLKAVREGSSRFMPLSEQKVLDAEDKKEYGILIHDKLYRNISRAYAQLQARKVPEILDSDILLEAIKEFFGAEGQSGEEYGVMRLSNYKNRNPALVVLREDINYWFKTKKEAGSGIAGKDKTANYSKVIGMLSLKALDRLHPVTKAKSASEALREKKEITVGKITLRKNGREIELINNETGETTKNGKIKIGSSFEKALLKPTNTEAVELNNFLNLQEKNVSTSEKITLAIEYVDKYMKQHNLTQFDLEKVFFSQLGVPTIENWGKHTAYGTSSSNSNIFLLAGVLAPDFMLRYRKYFKVALELNGAVYNQFVEESMAKIREVKKGNQEIELQIDDEMGEELDMPDVRDIDNEAPFEQPEPDITPLIEDIKHLVTSSPSEWAKSDMDKIRELAKSDKAGARKELQRIYNEIHLLTIMRKSGLSIKDLKDKTESELGNLVAQYANGEAFVQNSNHISKLDKSSTIISYAVALKNIKDSFDKDEWKLLDKLIYSDLQLNIDTFARLAPKTYLTSDPLPASLRLNFEFNPAEWKSSESDYVLNMPQLFDRLQVGYKDIKVSGVKAMSLVDIISAKQQLIENNLTYIQNIFSIHVKEKITGQLQGADIETVQWFEKLVFEELKKINSLNNISIKYWNGGFSIKRDKNFISYSDYAKSVYPNKEDESKKDALLVALQMKELLSYHIPNFVGSLYRYMGYAKEATGEFNLAEQERYKKMLLKWGRVYNYIMNGSAKRQEVEAGTKPEKPFIPKAYSKQAFIVGYIGQHKSKFMKDNPSLSEEEAILALEEKGAKLFGDRTYFNPLFVNPKYYAIENETTNIELTMTGFLEDLLRNAKEDLTLINWFSYRHEAIATKLPHYVTDKMKQWFKMISRSSQIGNEIINKADIKKDDYIFFRVKETKEVEIAGNFFPRQVDVMYYGKVTSIENDTIEVESGETKKSFPLSQIYTIDDYGNYLQDKVEALPGRAKLNTNEQIEKVEGKIMSILESSMQTWVLLTRSYLNAMPSRVRNLVGGRISGIEEYVPLLRHLGKLSQDKQQELSAMLARLGQSESDVNSKYYKAFAEVSGFGSRTILDMLGGRSATTLNSKELPVPTKNIIEKLKFFKQLIADSKVYDKFIEKKQELYRELLKHKKGSNQYNQIDGMIRLLEYERDLSEQQLEDKLTAIENTPELQNLYEDFKALIETNNSAFRYNVTSDIALKLYREHTKNALMDKRMEYVNKDEGFLRKTTFEIAFLQEYERSHNLDRALIYAQGAVKRQHAFYNDMSRVFAHSKASGRILNTLRHYTYNKITVLNQLFKDSKEVRELYGWNTLFKSVFSRNIRINGDEVEIFGSNGSVAQYSPANRIANMLLFNIMLYNLSSIIPGLQFVGNPVLMAVIGLTDVMARAFDPDDEDNPDKIDIFYAIAQTLTLRGGVGKNFLYSAVAQYMLSDEDTTVGDVLYNYAPSSVRQGIKLYNLSGSLKDVALELHGVSSGKINLSNTLKTGNNVVGLASGFKISLTGSSLFSTIDRLTSSPIERQLRKSTSLDFDSFMDSIEKDMEEYKRATKERFSLTKPFNKFGDFK